MTLKSALLFLGRLLVSTIAFVVGMLLGGILHELQRHLGRMTIDLEAVRLAERRLRVDGLLDTEPNQLFEGIAVSRVDDVRAPSAGINDAWVSPVVISK